MTRNEGVRFAATFIAGVLVGVGAGFGLSAQRGDVSTRSGAVPAASGQAERMRADPVDPRAPMIRVSLNGPADAELRCTVGITGGSGDQPSPPPPTTIKLDSSGQGGIRLDYSRNPGAVSDRTFTITCARSDGGEFGRIAVTIPRT